MCRRLQVFASVLNIAHHAEKHFPDILLDVVVGSFVAFVLVDRRQHIEEFVDDRTGFSTSLLIYGRLGGVEEQLHHHYMSDFVKDITVFEPPHS